MKFWLENEMKIGVRFVFVKISRVKNLEAHPSSVEKIPTCVEMVKYELLRVETRKLRTLLSVKTIHFFLLIDLKEFSLV